LHDQEFALAHRSRAACLLCQSNCGSDSSARVENNFYLKENSMLYVGEARVAQLTLPRARVMALVRRSPLLPGMPDAFDRAPLP
jgi:hypothetical protein